MYPIFCVRGYTEKYVFFSVMKNSSDLTDDFFCDVIVSDFPERRTGKLKINLSAERIKYYERND